jgi:hypothetical protein
MKTYIYIYHTSLKLLRMRNVSDKSCRENQNTHFVFKTFRKSCRLCYNVEKYFRAGQATDNNIAHAHCMLDTYIYKYIHSGCVILIVFPLQQWLHERASLLSYTYIAYPVICMAEGTTAPLSSVLKKLTNPQLVKNVENILPLVTNLGTWIQ